MKLALQIISALFITSGLVKLVIAIIQRRRSRK